VSEKLRVQVDQEKELITEEISSVWTKNSGYSLQIARKLWFLRKALL